MTSFEKRFCNKINFHSTEVDHIANVPIFTGARKAETKESLSQVRGKLALSSTTLRNPVEAF